MKLAFAFLSAALALGTAVPETAWGAQNEVVNHRNAAQTAARAAKAERQNVEAVEKAARKILEKMRRLAEGPKTPQTLAMLKQLQEKLESLGKQAKGQATAAGKHASLARENANSAKDAAGR